MKGKAFYKPVLFILLFGVCLQLTAQRVRAIGGLGASAYLGDLVQGAPIFKQVSPAVTLGASYDLQQQLRLRLALSLMGVKGDDASSSRTDLRARNLNFKSFIWEFSTVAEYDFLDRDIYNIVPYAFLGLGIYHFNPTTIDKNGNKVKLHDIGTEGQYLPVAGYPKPYHRLGINLPFGIGTRYEVSEDFAVGFEFCYRFLFTDYLDDVSGPNYVDPAIFLQYNQPEAAELSYRADPTAKYNLNNARGNPKSKDSYYSFQVTVSIRLNNVTLGGDLGTGGLFRSRSSMRNPKRVY